MLDDLRDDIVSWFLDPCSGGLSHGFFYLVLMKCFLWVCANSDQRCFPFIYVSNVVPLFSQSDQKLIELI